MSPLFSRLLKFFGVREESNNSHHVNKILTPHKFTELEQIIGCPIRNKSHYIQALMHRSFLEELEDDDTSNERLEFLGDSVLSLVVAEYLFENFPKEDEGFMTKVRAKLVNRFALSDAAEEIGLANFILINQNLTNTFAKASKTVLSDAFEAIIGAIYLDHGLEITKKFINRVLIEPITKAEDYLVDENYKSQLLEYAQANKLEVPSYVVIKEEGPQHDRVFTIKVNIGEDYFGIGKGKNKKTAEQNAAKATLEKIAH
ncbi:MAG TPA: ribonuclease III [Ignavibacteriales bacterium]|nr:ribonuclease III [Ignavibacteriales bacterium]